MEVRKLSTLVAFFMTLFVDKNSADLVFSECDRSKTGSDKFYEFKYNDLKGEEVSLKNYTNHVTLIVNVASFWGLTKQNYEELNALLDEYGGDDACSLKVIAFPSGQFHNQEPDKPEELLEILKFVRPGKGFTPKMDFSTKVDVNGKDESPIFSFLKDICPRPSAIISGDGDVNWKPLKVSDVRWNFEKFLIDHKGIPVRRYLHFTMPMEMKHEIEIAIKNCTENKNTEEEKRKEEEKKEAAVIEDEQRSKGYSEQKDEKVSEQKDEKSEEKINSSKDDNSENETNQSKKSDDNGKIEEPAKSENLSTSTLTQTPKMEQGQLQTQNTNPVRKRSKIPRITYKGRFMRMLRKSYEK